MHRFPLVTSFSRSQWARTARHAVFCPLLGIREIRDLDVPGHFADLHRQWSAKLLSLKRIGWAPLQDERALNQALYCPVFGAKTTGDGFSLPCQRTRICPFCFARRMVVGPYFAVIYACYGTMRTYNLVDGKRALYPPLGAGHLTEFSTSISYTRPGGRMKTLVKAIEERRHEELDRVRYDGAFILQTVEVFPDRLVLWRRGLILHARAQKLWEALPTRRRDHRIETRKVRFHPEISRRVIAHAVSRVCRYPEQMFRAKASEVAVVLHNLAEVKLLTCYGNFRNAGIREAIRRARANRLN